MTTCQIYTMPLRRLASIHKPKDHPHQSAPNQGESPLRGVECITGAWGLFIF